MGCGEEKGWSLTEEESQKKGADINKDCYISLFMFLQWWLEKVIIDLVVVIKMMNISQEKENP